MNAQPLIPCPRCEASLFAVEGGADGWCAKCGAVLSTPQAADNRQWSRKAIVSLLLGLGSIIGMAFTAIPAILLGAFALREITARPEQLKGKAVAGTGIAAGVFLGLCCTPLMATFSLQIAGIIQARERSDEAEFVLKIADEIGAIVPEELVPRRAERNPIFRERSVTFIDEDDRPKQHFFVYERRDKALASTVETTFKGKLASRKQPVLISDVIEVKAYEFAGVKIETDYQEDILGGEVREIRYCQFAAGEAQVAVYWRSNKPKSDTDAKARREEQFRQLLESLVTTALENDSE